MNSPIAALLVFILALGAGLADARAQNSPPNAQRLGAQTKSDDLIKALTPPGTGAPDIFTTRGIRLKNTAPGPQGGDNASSGPPSVALDVKFARNSAVLTDEAKHLIQQLASAINSEQLADYRFRLEGHTDSTGRPDTNLTLSQQRAEAVKEYMTASLGVTAQRLETVGRGQEQPLDPVHPESGVNRRVQVVNITAK